LYTLGEDQSPVTHTNAAMLTIRLVDEYAKISICEILAHLRREMITGKRKTAIIFQTAAGITKD